jgi:predicted  nucleic acid-binding Zn-ribbon protein
MGKSKIIREVFNDVTPTGRKQRLRSDDELLAYREAHRKKFFSRHPDLISEFQSVHGDKYDYSRFEYIDSSTPSIIHCAKHGDFYQLAMTHISGTGCPSCGAEKSRRSKILSLSRLLEQFRDAHGDKYDYSKVVYEHRSKKVTIICSEHGEFEQSPSNHKLGRGCKQCANENLSRSKRHSRDQIIEMMRKVHGEKYDYSSVEYRNMQSKIEIICPEHGLFYQKCQHHLNGSGCPRCTVKRDLSSKTPEVIEAFERVHGEKYDYSKVIYNGANSKIVVVCPMHGEFYPTPSNHKKGSGCRKCGQVQRFKTLGKTRP